MASPGPDSAAGSGDSLKWTLADGEEVEPTRAWSKLKLKRNVQRVQTPDTHTRIERRETELDIPNGDVLIHAGDFSNIGEPDKIEAFAQWIASQPHRHKIVIAGNHDLSLDPSSYATTRVSIARGALPEACPHEELKHRLRGVCNYLEDSGITIDGVRFYGSPWTPEFYGWGFNAERGDEIAAIWRRIPTETDVLITHGPPVGIGDACFDGQRAGCVDLLREIETRVMPMAHFFGHIHEGYGAYKYSGVRTVFVNASSCDFRYKCRNPPIIIDVPKRTAAPELDKASAAADA